MVDNFTANTTRSYIYVGAQPAVLTGVPGVGEISLESLFTAARVRFIKNQAGQSFNPTYPGVATFKKLIPSESYLISVGGESFESDNFLPSNNPAYSANLTKAIADGSDIKPGDIHLVSSQPGYLDVLFQAPIGFSPTSYTVQLSRNGTSWTNESTTTTGIAEYRGLLGGDWYARVRANYDINSSDWVTTANPLAVPTPPPTNLVIASALPNVITGSWTPPANVSPSGYTIAITTVDPTGVQNWIRSQTVTTSSFSLGGVPPGTYIYRVRVNVSGGTSSVYALSGEITVLDAGQIPTPTNLTIRSLKGGEDPGQIEVSWKLPTGVTITSLTLERSGSDGSSNTWQATQTLAANATSYTYTGLTKGLYLFRIRLNTSTDSSAFVQSFNPYRVFDTRVTRSNPRGGCSLGVATSGSWIEFDANYSGLPAQSELQANGGTIAAVGFYSGAIGNPFRFYYILGDAYYLTEFESGTTSLT